MFAPVKVIDTKADDNSKARRKQQKPDFKGFSFIVLVSVLSCAIRAGWFLSHSPHYDTAKTISRILLGLFMFGAATLRLDSEKVDRLLCPIVPPPLSPKLCVYASGIVEAICGMLLLFSPGGKDYEEYGGMLVVVLLLAVFPANIYHAFSLEAQIDTCFAGQEFILYLRIIIQFLFLGWGGWHAGSHDIFLNSFTKYR